MFGISIILTKDLQRLRKSFIKVDETKLELDSKESFLAKQDEEINNRLKELHQLREE
jgi:hypothetical protein